GALVADAVRGGNLGRVQGTGIPDLRAGERAPGREQRLAEQRVRTHDLVDERAYLRILGDERVGQTSDQRRDARLFRIREPDPEVETEGRRDLFVKVRADALSGDATNQLTDQPSVGRRVVAVPRTRLPMRNLLRQRVDD